ncbi:hypothetical protein [Paenibacillus sinopodophylli]|uniref:hypothetical protein n=1 Tax=Paenibacillus sinopodophylli TaxID=1837342 RepID=UPI0014862432|nr:hypothetical protein [Paenibacillus sinopodophylli]
MDYTYTNEQQMRGYQQQSAPASSDCGCGGPRSIMPPPPPGGFGPGGFGPGGPGGPGPFPPGPGPFPPGPGPFPPGPGPFPPGPGPFPPGPGPFPPGPGPFPPGPGPFPPGPGPFPPGPGPFPPGPGPFPPGPGPFPPGPGPFPPGPGPFPPPRPPFPFPIPFPIPWPFPPGPQASVTVVINGGRTFPNVTQAYRVPFRPGLTIYQALAETGAVRFNFNGQIISVSGVPIGGNISYQLQLNGRVIPASLLSFPVQRNDSVALVLIYNPLVREEETEFADESDGFDFTSEN